MTITFVRWCGQDSALVFAGTALEAYQFEFPGTGMSDFLTDLAAGEFVYETHELSNGEGIEVGQYL